MLCAPIPPPPDNAAAFPPPLSEDSTTREVVEAITEQPGSSCAGCHTTLINPYGFATEGFDALGRPRTDQRLFDQWGQLVAERAVDTTTEIISDGRRVPVADAQGLSEALLASGELERCFARHYAEFTFGRHTEGNADACVIDDLEARLRAGDSLSVVLRDVALQPTFQRRTMELP